MSPTDQSDIDPLADLDDDLGDDWESAFQSEDFMFSEDDEANDFFLFDENDSEEDVDELTAILETAEQETLKEQQVAAEPSTKEASATESESQPLKAQLADKLKTGLIFFKNRPLYQRIAAITVPCLLLLIMVATFFFQSTSEELAQTNQPDVIIADIQVGPKVQNEPEPIIEPEPVIEVVPAEVPPKKTQDEPQSAQARTIRKQWDFPTFTIVNATPGTETLFINVKLSLIAILPEGESLPESKNVWVKDTIYQFYQNRSPHELKRFALARGEMIHKLHGWLKKEWPDSPVNTVIFSKYQVVSTPQTS